MRWLPRPPRSTNPARCKCSINSRILGGILVQRAAASCDDTRLFQPLRPAGGEACAAIAPTLSAEALWACASILPGSGMMAAEEAYRPSCRSRSTHRRFDTTRRKLPARRPHGNRPGKGRARCQQSTGLPRTIRRSSDNARCPSFLEPLQGICDLANLVRLGVVTKRPRYCDPSAEVVMREVSMASPSALIDEACALQLCNEISNLWRHEHPTPASTKR